MIRCEGFDLSVCAPSPRPYFQDGTPRGLSTHDHRTQELCECLTDEGCQCLMWATRNGSTLLTIYKGRGVCRDCAFMPEVKTNE